MNNVENQNPNRFSRLRRSKLGMSVAGLAITAAAVFGTAKIEQGNSTQSIVPKDKIVQVEGKTLAPDGFKAVRMTHSEALRELQGANGMENYIVATDSQGHEGVYQFSIPDPRNGSQQVDWVANRMADLGSDIASATHTFPNAAEVVTVSSNHDGATAEYLLVQDPKSPHPFAFPIGSVGTEAIGQGTSVIPAK